MAAQEECPVCCESFNQSSHKPLNCPYCKVEMCRTCTGQAIMYDEGDPGCQSCKKVWSDDVLYSYFTKKFVNTEIAKKLEKKYADLEMSLLPESQYFASKIKKVDQMEKEWKLIDINRIEAIKINLLQLNVRIVRVNQQKILIHGIDDESIEKHFKFSKCLNVKETLKSCMVFWHNLILSNQYYSRKRYVYIAYWRGKPGNLEDIKPYIDQLAEYNVELCKYTVMPQQRRKWAYHDARRFLQRGTDVDLQEPIELRVDYYQIDRYREIRKKGNTKYIRKCASESCNGYLNEEALCEQCDTQYCKKCEEIKKEAHECKQENVDSVKMKYKNSKPCPNPNCGVPIFKSSGCSQMWCTACHTIFDWNTQSIVETKNIHNPHYHEYNRLKNIEVNNGVAAVAAEPDEGECGRPSRTVMLKISEQLGLKNEYGEKDKYGYATIISPRHHKIEFLQEFRRVLGEILDGTRMRRYPDRPYNENTLIENRIKVIQGIASKDDLGQIALETVRYNTFNMKARELHYMLCTTGIDILRKLATGENIKMHYIELYNLCCMFNEEGRKLHNTYKYKFHYLCWYAYHLNFISDVTIVSSKKGKCDTRILFEYDPHLKEYINLLKKEIAEENTTVST